MAVGDLTERNLITLTLNVAARRVLTIAGIVGTDAAYRQAEEDDK
jgi:hypothetical protein